MNGIFKALKSLIEAHQDVTMTNDTQLAMFNLIDTTMGNGAANAFGAALHCSSGEEGYPGSTYVIRGEAVYLWLVMKGSM